MIAKEANNGFIINLIESILIVIVIIMLVMGMRAGVLIGSSLIFSIGGTLLIMSFLGVGLNRTSLAGFIIAMGMLMDNAIVVTDNAQIAIARGIDRRKALIDGATGPQWGLLGATFIAICSFLPLYLAPSSVAEIVKPLFVVLAISLGLSWVLALTQTTTFGNFILKAKAKDGSKDPYDKPFYHKFASILSTLIRKKALTLGSITALFILSPHRHGADAPELLPFSGQALLSGRCILSGRVQHPRSRNRNEKGGSASDAAAGSETGIRHIRQHTVALLSGLHFRRSQT